MDHATAHSNEDRFRCFIYEELRRNGGQVGGYNVAISGDATCDGVQAPNEGSTTLVSITILIYDRYLSIVSYCYSFCNNVGRFSW